LAKRQGREKPREKKFLTISEKFLSRGRDSDFAQFAGKKRTLKREKKDLRVGAKRCRLQAVMEQFRHRQEKKRPKRQNKLAGLASTTGSSYWHD